MLCDTAAVVTHDRRPAIAVFFGYERGCWVSLDRRSRRCREVDTKRSRWETIGALFRRDSSDAATFATLEVY